MTFQEMKERLARRVNAKDDKLNGLTDRRFGDAINEAYKRLLRKPYMARVRETTTTVASVAGTQGYDVEDCARINRIWETTNDRKLEMRPLTWLRQADPDPQEGTPCIWIPTSIANTTQSFLLWPTPSAVITYTLDIVLSVADMTSDQEEPLLPDDFHDLLLDMAELKERRKTDDAARYGMLQQAIRDGERDLAAWIVGHPDWQPVMSGERTGISTLGSWYPADRFI